MTSPSAPADTIDARFRARAASDPDRLAVLDDAGVLTYGRLDAAVDRLAAALQRRGLAPGQTVALLLGNGRDFLTGYFAAVRAGAVPVPCHPQLAGEELQALLAHAEVSVILAEAACRPAVDGVRAELSARVFVYAAADDATPPDGRGPARLTAGGSGQPSDAPGDPWEPLASLLSEPGRPERLAADPGGVAALHYTSGTTGRPKGVLLSHRAVLSTADVKARAYQLHPGSILFCAPPLHHAAAMNSAVHEALLERRRGSRADQAAGPLLGRRRVDRAPGHFHLDGADALPLDPRPARLRGSRLLGAGGVPLRRHADAARRHPAPVRGAPRRPSAAELWSDRKRPDVHLHRRRRDAGARRGRSADRCPATRSASWARMAETARLAPRATCCTAARA